MPEVTYTDPAGEVHTVDVAEGHSLMEGAILNGVDGIAADCGGAAICGTCHVHVAPDWFAKIGGPHAEESETLGLRHNVVDSSRLSCQIPMSGDLGGIAVTAVGEE